MILGILASPALAVDILEKIFGIKDTVFGKVDSVLGKIFKKDDCGCPCRDYYVAKCQVSDGF